MKRREAEEMRRVAALHGALCPDGAPQERKVSFVPFLARYGRGLIDDMLAAATAHARGIVAGQPGVASPRSASVSAQR